MWEDYKKVNDYAKEAAKALNKIKKIKLCFI